MATKTRTRKVTPITAAIIVKKYVTGPNAGEVVEDTHPLVGGRVELNHLMGEVGTEKGIYPHRFEVIEVRKA